MAYCESWKVGNRCAAIPAGVRDGGEMRWRGKGDGVT